MLRRDFRIADIRICLEHHESPLSVLAQYLQKQGLGSSLIGLEKRFLPLGYVDELESLLPNAILADAGPVLD